MKKAIGVRNEFLILKISTFFLFFAIALYVMVTYSDYWIVMLIPVFICGVVFILALADLILLPKNIVLLEGKTFTVYKNRWKKIEFDASEIEDYNVFLKTADKRGGTLSISLDDGETVYAKCLSNYQDVVDTIKLLSKIGEK